MSNVRSGRDIDSALRRKGFRCVIDGDHICYHFASDVAKTKTKMSHGMKGRTIGAELIAVMARQLQLSKVQFLALVDCTLSEEQYRTFLKRNYNST
ncbi:MAG: hypothetical protein ACRC46_12435 [Thermoguttaceae bacterium]